MDKKKQILLIISNKLSMLRKSKGITQEELANILKVKRATYTNWETGRTEIPLDKLNSIAIYYNVAIDYMFDFNNNKSNYNKELDYKKLALNLANYIKVNKLKIEALAIDAGTTVSTIWAYLHNNVKIRTVYLYLICKNNSLSADKLLERF